MTEFEEFKDDPKALELARRLARADFSADSRVRASLRARLLRIERGEGRPALPYARLAFTLAALALVLATPLRGRLARLLRGRPQPAAVVLPVLPGHFPADTSARAEPVFEIVQGKLVEADGRRATVWELDGRTVTFETRQVTNDDIFQVPTL